MLYHPREMGYNDVANGIYNPLKFSSHSSEKIVMTPSEWVQRLLYLRVPGAIIPFSLKGRGYLKPVYDNGFQQIVLLTGRQVEKSTTLAAKLFGWMTNIPGFKAIYAGPDDHTIKTFSESRLYEFIDASPLLDTHFMQGPNVVRNIGIIKMSNGSVTYLKNSARQGSNFRGLSAEAFVVDEMQGMLEEVMPVGQECLSHGKRQIEMYCGTPLTMHNFAQKQWKRSTQNEWLIPCHSCGKLVSTPEYTGMVHHWINIGIPNITPTGLICEKCGSRIRSTLGQWVRMFPKKRIEGFRIPQPIGEWANFAKIYFDKLERYPLPQFMNEVLGVSYDSAAVFLTEDEVYKRCMVHLKMMEKKDRSMRGKVMVAGVDWGHSNVKDGGTTVVVIFAIDPQFGHMEMVYGRIYPHTMSKVAQTTDMIQRLRDFDVNIVCADLGANGDRNERLSEALGANRVTQIMYTAGEAYVNYENVTSVFRVGKTPAMSTFHSDFVTRGRVRLINQEKFEPLFADQMMGAGKEVTKQGKLHYVKMDGQDDFLQACVYANMARRLSEGIDLVDYISLSYERVIENNDSRLSVDEGVYPNWNSKM